MENNDSIKASMIDAINSGGAWFCTRKNNYLKIGAGSDGRMFARECVLKDGQLEGGAYTFGTDWFDISFHGRWIDIYVDPDTLKSWDIRYDAGRGTFFKSAEGGGSPGVLLEFCRQADQEALSGDLNAFHIDGTGFAAGLEPSEERMGKREDILSKVDLDQIEK